MFVFDSSSFQSLTILTTLYLRQNYVTWHVVGLAVIHKPCISADLLPILLHMFYVVLARRLLFPGWKTCGDRISVKFVIQVKLWPTFVFRPSLRKH
ncbi:hypothetical protein VNO78_23908 [Psophocarpus tetragonolobus]|uniref:Uncharacterized protein n=1 Tax=Psophocarpus tetragonolobus TaxID=3891 RepID=A0AAN9S4V3_PSOTE